MNLKYQRDKAKSLEQDIIDVQENVPTSLVFTGYDDNYMYFIDEFAEEKQMDMFDEMSK